MQSCLLYLGKAVLAEGRRGEALEVLEEAMAISRANRARVPRSEHLGELSPKRRRTRSNAGGRSPRAKRSFVRARSATTICASIRTPSTTALDLGEWDEAERYARALEDYTRPEPLPWSDFFVRRGRALAALGRGRRDESTKPELERLQAEARRLDYRIALPAIEQALAGF